MVWIKKISQTNTYRTYGRARIDEWRAEGEIKPNKQGGRIYYDKAKLEKLAGVNKLIERI